MNCNSNSISNDPACPLKPTLKHKGRSAPIRIHRTVLLYLASVMLCTAATSPTNAQYLAWPPSPRDDGIVNCAPEKCLAYISWAGTGQYDRSANPTESYMGQAEIQECIEKLQAAVLKSIRANVPKTNLSQALLDNAPEMFLKQPAAFFASDFHIKDDSFDGAAVIKLGNLEDNAKAIIKAVMEEATDVEFTPVEVEGSKCYSISNERAPDVQFGIVDNYFIVSAGEIKIADVRANMKTPAPKWLVEIDERIAIERPGLTCYVDLKRITEFALEVAEQTGSPSEKEMEKFIALDKLLSLTKFESLQYQSGMNSDGFNQVFHINHSAPNEGMLKALAGQTLDKGDIAEIPEETGLAAAVKLDVTSMVSLVRGLVKVGDANAESKIREFQTVAKERFNIDPQQDLVEQLEGTLFFYSDTSLTSPKALGAVQVKDPASFSKTIEKLNQQIKQVLAASGQELTKSEKQGHTFFEAPLPNGLSVCYGLVGDRLYLCNTVRGITSHLRKRKRDYGKLIQTPRYQAVIEESTSKGFEGLVAFNNFNTAAVIETGLPMAALMLQGYLDREVFDFTFEDLPNVGVLVNGLRPSSSFVYRTDTGLAMRMKNDLPLGYDVTTSGILIGMLLPAVQQVRAAARRTQAMNNLRELVLGLLNYESAKGHFPPAYSIDDQGNPLLSWRVHILPYLNENQLYEQFHLDEPWNSPHNVTLADQMPAVFSHSGFALEENHTVYVAPVGDDSILSAGPIDDTGAGHRFSDITDGSANTQLLIAVDESNSVLWTAPEDLRYDNLSDGQLVDAVVGYLNLMTTARADGATYGIEAETVTELGGQGLRGCFKKSDGVNFELAP